VSRLIRTSELAKRPIVTPAGKDVVQIRPSSPARG
jgi:hypothetical protein